jgi:hypothetical protein
MLNAHVNHRALLEAMGGDRPFSGPGSILDSHRRLNGPGGQAPPQERSRVNTPGLLAPGGTTAGPNQPAPPLLAPGGTTAVSTEPENKNYGVGAGFDQTKFNNPAHISPKYQIGRTLSQFDPNQGITPEVLTALNALGLGTFSGARDKLQIGGNVDPRFDGFTDLDLIVGFNDPNNLNKQWNYQASNPNAPQAGGGMMSGMAMPSMMGGLASQPQGQAGPMAGVQQALSPYTEQSPNIEALLELLAQG